MAETDSLDKLGNEVAITGKLEESGVSLQAKSRAVAAFDRLLGSISDLPAAWFEGKARRARLTQEIEERLRRAEAAVAERMIGEEFGQGSALIIDLLRDRARKQINTAGVGLETLDALRLQDHSSREGKTTIPDAEFIDPDWFNSYARFAEEVSAEDIQNVWGRVLAGEINKPGSFSRATLRFISEIDRELIAACEHVAARSLGTFIRRPSELRGDDLQRLLDLQSGGVLEEVGSLTYKLTMTIQDNGVAYQAAKRNIMIIEGEPGTQLSAEIIGITRVGREVFSLLSSSNEREELVAMGRAVSKSGLKRVTVAEYVPAGERLQTSNSEIVWEA